MNTQPRILGLSNSMADQCPVCGYNQPDWPHPDVCPHCAEATPEQQNHHLKWAAAVSAALEKRLSADGFTLRALIPVEVQEHVISGLRQLIAELDTEPYPTPSYDVTAAVERAREALVSYDLAVAGQ